MLRFLLDVDGVIADFKHVFLKAAEYVTGRKFDQSLANTHWDLADATDLNLRERDKVYDLLCCKNVALTIPSMPGAAEAVRELDKWADILFVTSPMEGAPTWCFDRGAWLEAHFGARLGKRVIYTSHKWAVVGDVLVDDKPKHLHEWHEEMSNYKEVALPVCWAYEHNTSCPFMRTNDWQDLINIAERGYLVETA